MRRVAVLPWADRVTYFRRGGVGVFSCSWCHRGHYSMQLMKTHSRCRTCNVVCRVRHLPAQRVVLRLIGWP